MASDKKRKREASRAYRRNNPKKRKATNHKYYHEHSEKILDRLHKNRDEEKQKLRGMRVNFKTKLRELPGMNTLDYEHDDNPKAAAMNMYLNCLGQRGTTLCICGKVGAAKP